MLAYFFITVAECLRDLPSGEKTHFDPQSQRVSVLQSLLGMAVEALVAEARTS